MKGGVHMQKMAETTMRIADGGLYVVTCMKHSPRVYQQYFLTKGAAYIAYKTHRSHSEFCAWREL